MRILDTDTWKETADKIYNDMAVGQSCVVFGILEVCNDAGRMIGTESKGEKVIAELKRLDTLENLRPMGKKMTRKRKKIPNTIGGYVAHKIFGYKHVVKNSDLVYTVWRIQ